MGLPNIGISGLILIVIMLIIVFGPKKLPEIGKSIGKSLREFKHATSGQEDHEEAKTSATQKDTATQPSPTKTTTAATTVAEEEKTSSTKER